MSQLKKYVLIGLALLTLGFGLGRYSTPTKTVIQTKIVTVEAKAIDTDQNKVVVKTEIDQPNGAKEIVTKTTDNTKTDETDSIATTASQAKEVTKESSKVIVNFMVGSKLSLSPVPIYGGSISKEILGPIRLGAWGFSDGTAGLSLGIDL